MAKVTLKKQNGSALVIKRPHITEKATNLSEKNAYTFLVDSTATKKDIEKAVVEMYKVTPTKVNVVNTPGKKVNRRGISGRVSGFKKAIVYLKKGDSIELI